MSYPREHHTTTRQKVVTVRSSLFFVAVFVVLPSLAYLL